MDCNETSAFKNCFFYIYLLIKNGGVGGLGGLDVKAFSESTCCMTHVFLFQTKYLYLWRTFKETFSVFVVCSSEIAAVKLLCPNRYRLLTVIYFQICLIDRTFLIVNFTFLDCNITLYIISRIHCRMSVKCWYDCR